MEKNCGNCRFYRPIVGEPPAGYCDFAEFKVLPFWMDTPENISKIRALRGSDVTPERGTECDAFIGVPSASDALLQPKIWQRHRKGRTSENA